MIRGCGQETYTLATTDLRDCRTFARFIKKKKREKKGKRNLFSGFYQLTRIVVSISLNGTLCKCTH